MGRYVELQHVRHGVDPESGLSFVGPASYFVSYAWDTPWDSLVSALKAHSTRVMAEAAAAVGRGSKEGGSGGGRPELHRSLEYRHPPYYFLDIFGTAQHLSAPPWVCAHGGVRAGCRGCRDLAADAPE